MNNISAVMQSNEASASNRLRTLTLIFIVIGLLISGYLSYAKLTNTAMVCVQGSVFNCEKVQSHPIGHLRIGTTVNIPIAVLGFGMYLAMAAIHILQPHIGFLRQNGFLLYFLLLLFGWMYSMYLVYAQFVIIQGLCMWCLMHEANITIMFVIGIFRTRKFLAGDFNA